MAPEILHPSAYENSASIAILGPSKWPKTTTLGSGRPTYQNESP